MQMTITHYSCDTRRTYSSLLNWKNVPTSAGIEPTLCFINGLEKNMTCAE